jgi:hypothetical protein
VELKGRNDGETREGFNVIGLSVGKTVSVGLIVLPTVGLKSDGAEVDAAEGKLELMIAGVEVDCLIAVGALLEEIIGCMG